LKLETVNLKPGAFGLLLPKLLAAQEREGFWFQRQASTSAQQIDWLFGLVFFVSLFFFVLIVVLMIVFVVRYRRREGAGPEPSTSHNFLLEMVWTGIPVVLVMVMFYFGLKTYLDLRMAPANAMEIQVLGKKWAWSYTYPQAGYEEQPQAEDKPAELHVPRGEPVKLVLTSEDVIHGFFIPAFRLKMDAVPGRYNMMWFTATEPGEYLVQCSVYCGTRHSEMRSVCIVHPDRADFDRWLNGAKLKSQGALTPAERGRRLYIGKFSCAQCHSADGRRIIGPTFKDLYGSETPLSDGSRVPVDENYIRESILDPGAKIVAGYRNEMTSFRGRITDKEIGDLIEYIKSLSKNYQPAPAPQPAPDAKAPAPQPAPAKKGAADGQ
jgi:cytochrome c oxidase subunit 2